MSAPGEIMIMLEPISEMLAWMLRLVPCPMASMVMTDAMPMMMPRAVRNDRVLLAAMARRAILKRLAMFMVTVVYSSELAGSAASPSSAERMLWFWSSLITRPSRSMMLRLE